MQPPEAILPPGARDLLVSPRIAATGFRDCDARWRYPEDIDLPGAVAFGRGLGTQMWERGLRPEIVVGHDYRSYSPAIKHALILGLIDAGIRVRDIGLSLSPMAYFAQIRLDAPAVAMVTASHNPNGWTGMKLGFEPPLTHGPQDMARLRDIVLGDAGIARPGGSWHQVEGMRAAYIDDVVGDFRMTRPLRAVCATGNGTAGAFAPEVLARIGVEVVARHTGLDDTFPNYNPNPEAMQMLRDMAAALRESGADIALGFDGDGDRCGVVDNEGVAIFPDKIGLILARDLAERHPGAIFVVDVKSTGLFARDPVLIAAGARVGYWRTGHSHIKRRMRDLGAHAGFEKSGHYFFAPPIGHGFDCAMRAGVEVCRLLDRNRGRSIADLARALPRTWSTPTMSAHCADDEKAAVLARLRGALADRAVQGGMLGGQRITEIVSVDGARVLLANGAWALLRASSNLPNLVVVCESPESEAELRAIFADLDALIRAEHGIGAYDQTL